MLYINDLLSNDITPCASYMEVKIAWILFMDLPKVFEKSDLDLYNRLKMTTILIFEQ